MIFNDDIPIILYLQVTIAIQVPFSGMISSKK